MAIQKITPFIWFEEGAKEAADFYVSVFGKDSKITHVSKLENAPSGTVEIIALELQGQGFTIMSAGPFRKINEAISFVITCEDQAEIDHYWDALSAVPEAEQCGWLKDKYGVSWQVVPRIMNEMMGSGNTEKIARVTEAFLKMKKFDVATLQEVYDRS